MTIDRVISLRKDAGIEPVVVQQNDRQSRTVRFFLMDSSGSPFPTAGKQARMLFRKNGATSPAYEADVLPDGWIRLMIPDEVMANPGTGEMQLVLVEGDYILHSFMVPFHVRPSLSFVGETETPAEDPMAINWKNLPGRPATFPPSNHSHTPAEIGALTADGTAVNAAKLGGMAAEYYLRPHNLLDNSYFPNPINQRGQSSYSGQGYGIDRWYGRILAMTTQVRGADVTITATGTSFAGIRQKIENISDYAGKTVTFAVNLYCSVLPEIALQDASGTSIARKVGTGKENQILCVSCEVPADATPDSFVPTIMVRASAAGDYARLYWAAVYEGAYTAENLPPYQYKGYAAELAECQRYFRRTNAESTYATIGLGIARSATNAWINVPRKRMRIGKPSITVTGALKLYTGATSVDSTAISLDKISDGFIRLTVTAANLTAGAAIVATTADTAAFHIDESADL